MLSAFLSAFRTPDLRKKLLFTVGIIAIYRLGATLPSPGVSYGNVQKCLDTLENGSTVTPKLGATAGYAGLDGSGAYGTLTAGLTLETVDFWMLDASLLLDIEGDGQKSLGGRVRAAKQF